MTQSINSTHDGNGLWGSGVTIKRMVSGYIWNVSVAASGSDVDALMEALDTALAVDIECRERFGDDVATRDSYRASPTNRR
jgi:hypothetical protein